MLDGVVQERRPPDSRPSDRGQAIAVRSCLRHITRSGLGHPSLLASGRSNFTRRHSVSERGGFFDSSRLERNLWLQHRSSMVFQKSSATQLVPLWYSLYSRCYCGSWRGTSCDRKSHYRLAGALRARVGGLRNRRAFCSGLSCQPERLEAAGIEFIAENAAGLASASSSIAAR